jgi:Uncharacterised nucleotidyltransferase
MSFAAERPSAAVRRLLTTAIRDPAAVARLVPRELDLTLRLARRARLLGRLATELERSRLLRALPSKAAEQLESAAIAVEARCRVTRWELDRIRWAMRRSLPDTTVVVLKGCAYLLAHLPNAEGRMFADVDLLVAERDLDAVERALTRHGWRGTKLSPYDQHYYRAWTHELPPMVHVEREVELDLHHNILPRMARLKPRAQLLLQDSEPIAEQHFRKLADVDVVLHAMTHLMFDSALADALRDLVDIDDLLRHFAGGDRRFWERLLERAVALDLTRPAFYALRYTQRLLGTPTPDDVLRASRRGAPPAPITWLMDRLVPRALFPQHPDQPSVAADCARLFLYVRSLWIRMPPLLLARHMLYKVYVRCARRAPTHETGEAGE